MVSFVRMSLLAWFFFHWRGHGLIFIYVVSFLSACFLFYLRDFFYICVVSFLFAWFLFYSRVFFICVVSFLFACFLFLFA